MVEIRENLDARDHSPYAKWFDGLNAQAATKVVIAVTRMGHGNLSNIKRVVRWFTSAESISGPVIRSILAGTVITS